MPGGRDISGTWGRTQEEPLKEAAALDLSSVQFRRDDFVLGPHRYDRAASTSAMSNGAHRQAVYAQAAGIACCHSPLSYCSLSAPHLPSARGTVAYAPNQMTDLLARSTLLPQDCPVMGI